MAEPPTQQRRWDFDRVFRLLLALLTVLALFFLVRYLADVLIPFAVALLLAYLLNPIVTALEHRLKRRRLAVFITVIGCGIVCFALLVALLSVGSREIASIRNLTREFVHTPTAEDVRGVRKAFDDFVEAETNPFIQGLLQQLQEFISGPDAADVQLEQEFTTYLRAQDSPADREMLTRVQDRMVDARASEWDLGVLARRVSRSLAPSMMGFFSGTLSFALGLTGLVVVLLYLIFLLIDYPEFSRSWRGFLPPTHRDDITGFLDEFHLAMSKYFRGQFVIASTVGILFAIGFKLIGLRMAILLGLGVGAMNMVPYLQTVGLLPAMILALIRGLETEGSVWVPALLVLLVFGVVQLIQDALLNPIIMGRTVGLRPVVLLLGLFIWGKLLGFLGLVLAIPLTCLGLAYYRRFVLGDINARVIQEE